MHYRRKAAHTVGGLTGFNTPGCAKSSSCVFSASGARTPGPLEGDHLWSCFLSTSTTSTSVQFRKTPNHIALVHMIVGSSGKKKWLLHMTGPFVNFNNTVTLAPLSSIWAPVCVFFLLFGGKSVWGHRRPPWLMCSPSYLRSLDWNPDAAFMFTDVLEISGTNGWIRWVAPLLILKAPEEMLLHFKWRMIW